MKRGKAKPEYETGMKVFFDPQSQRVVVSFRGRITVLPGTYENEADAVKAGEHHCRQNGWIPEKDKSGAGVRRAWD